MQSEKINNQNFSTGISFKYRGSKTAGSRAFSVIMGTLLSCIITLAISYGGILTFTTMFSIPFNNLLLTVVAGVFALAMTIVFQLPKKAVKIAVPVVFILIIGYALIFLNEFVAGLEYIKDFVLVGIAKSMFWEEPLLSYVFSDAMKADTTAVLVVLTLLIITATSYFTVRKVNFVVPFIITFIFFEMGAAFGCVPNHFAFAAMFAGWMGLFSMHISVIATKIKRRRGDKKKSKTTIAKYKQSFISAIGIIVAVITFSVFSFGNIMVSIAGYDRPEDMKQLRSDFKDSISDFIDYIFGIDNDGSLREGRLYQMEERIIKNRHYLTVEAPVKQQTYLKGYVGGEYTGDTWQPVLTNENYKWLESSYEASGYYPQNMQGQLLNELSKTHSYVEKSAGIVKISELRRKKDYAYTAYVPYLSKDFGYIGDGMVEPDDKSEYAYTVYMDDSNIFKMNMSPLYNNTEFSSIWKEYSKYAKQNYSSYPSGMGDVESIVEGLKNGTGYGFKGKGKAYSTLEMADRIREYLKKNVKYSLTPERLPAEKDFVNWLLFEGKEGYSAHYATAMAIMLRMSGVPARYVEGYVITPEDLKNATKKDNGYYSLELTDFNAHAWVEIYDSNYGWMSIETTPGFYTGSLVGSAGNNQTDQLEQVVEENIIHNPESEEIVFMDDYTLESEKLEEDPPESPLGTIFVVIKYFFIVLGIALASIVAFLVISFIVLFIRRIIRLIILNRSLKDGNYKQKVNAIYRYYNRLLKFEGIVNTQNMQYLEFAEYICEKSERLKGEEPLEAMLIFLKYRFSNQQLSEAQLSCLENIALGYKNTSLKQLKGKEKFKFKYIENLG